MKLYLKSRGDVFNATAEYDEKNKTITVLQGTKINENFAEHIRGGKTAKHYREDKSYVDENNVVLKKCEFSSPSTAAQFVTGTSRNGYLVWKDENGECLKEKLKR